MKRIPVAEKPKTIFGKPFKIVDYDNPVVFQRFKCPKCGEVTQIEEQGFIEEASVTQLLTLLIYSLPRDKTPLPMKDAIEAGRFMKQLLSATDGVLILEEAEHDWIKEVVEKYSTQLYGVNASVLKDLLNSFERLKEGE